MAGVLVVSSELLVEESECSSALLGVGGGGRCLQAAVGGPCSLATGGVVFNSLSSLASVGGGRELLSVLGASSRLRWSPGEPPTVTVTGEGIDLSEWRVA